MAVVGPAESGRRLEPVLRKLVDDSAGAIAEEFRRAQRGLCEHLNQAARRMRQAETPEELWPVLLDASAPFRAAASVIVVAAGVAKSGDTETPLDSAPALLQCATSREPVVALATPGELSRVWMQALAAPAAQRIHLFPVPWRQETAAILYTDGASEPAALEMLCHMAGAALEGLKRAEAVKAAAALIGIAAPTPAPETPPPVETQKTAPASLGWDALDPAERKAHLAAQQFARVRVAEMQLFHAAAVRKGRKESGLYEALRESIDDARETFRKKFVPECPSMVDYIHLELLRVLAQDDVSRLGEKYPGPLL